ncbi:coiled-coil and C2 domain-containing protein 1-like isoform X1 [Penaeus monodon]|uniref:coiled-coil and C2 domain-containing protein 1-like isoform X1 n=1 Tax=Penaeus monodon TaxID=6687 RepID=UPI0018A728A7|nr:coiled-coil and C2 domain-containing protein 1-like isoform X1 [Penaeus monodon]
MFGFSGRKDDKSKQQKRGQGRKGGNLSQFGLMEVPDMDNLTIGADDDDDDGDLEAELLALTGGERKPKKAPKKIVSPHELDKMVNECMREDYDDELSDEDDPELLAELSALSSQGGDDEPAKPSPPPTAPSQPPPNNSYRNPEPRGHRPAPMMGGSNLVNLLAERMAMYEEAEANAKACGETSRARRFNRGLKTLHQMQRAVKAGQTINEEDIPPVVVVKHSAKSGGSGTPTSTPSPATTSPTEDAAPPPVPPHNRNSSASLVHEVAFHDPRYPSPRSSTRTSPVKQDSSSNTTNRPAPPPPRTTPPSGPPLQRSMSSSGPASAVRTRHTEYKMAALDAKKKGDKETAIMYMRIMKQLEPMLSAAESGQAVDLATLPGPPGTFVLQASPQPKPQPETVSTQPVAQDNAPAAAPVDAAPASAPDGPAAPTTVLEALEQRLAKYAEQRDKAKNEGNARKERMNQRIMKQFQDAIKCHKAGKPVPFDELPCPPGFPPIPVGDSKPPPAASDSAAPQADPSTGGPPAAKQPRPDAAQAADESKKTAPTPNVRKAPQSRVEKQLAFLIKRQNQFKQAALEAKKRGEIEQAKEYLRMSKGFNQLIDASRGGLPIDMNTVPVPPQEQIPASSNIDFELVDAEDCVVAPAGVSGDAAVTYAKLEEDLIAQIKMCAQTREHFKATGDVASSNRFEQLILHTKKDLDAVRAACKRGDTIPRFHYENRSFTIVQCNTDLNDSDCEACVLRGVNFNVQNPNDVDTYVKLEFPYPSDNPPQDRSNVVKDTNNPEYNHKVVFSIDRKARALARVFKRHALKVQVWAKGGWFHRDTMLGQVKIPLVDLETKCTIHESYDLTDEKKRMVGGKLEVKVRVRNPIVAKQLEKVTEKWLVIDGF